MYYHSARYYIPSLARWAAPDPMQGSMPEWSPYCYGYCNPITWQDSTGMVPDDSEPAASGGGNGNNNSSNNSSSGGTHTSTPTTGYWEKHDDQGYTGEKADAFGLQDVVVTAHGNKPAEKKAPEPTGGY